MNIVNINGLTIGSGEPKICVPITGNSSQEVINNTTEIIKLNPDLLEWRCDLFEGHLEISKVINLLKSIKEIALDTPLIFTLRTKEEGGKADVSGDYYYLLCNEIIQSKYCELIDIELKTKEEHLKELIKNAKANGIYSIISHHNFEGTPHIDNIVGMLKDEQNTGGDILKIALTPHKFNDVLTLMSSVTYFNENHSKKPVIAISMGERGMASRFLASFYGSHITFASAIEQSAPGQIHINKMRTLLNGISKLKTENGGT